ncbi:Glyoxylase, beta-lactamase superfamily II [Shimia gijangensis]|uniref:Glyoxylase, beta-lactamase superfamily II n=1 Tax=Shimia gijangensis TaxID=1470563 RepID=A0A1M6L151_9RHOB|nr:MBL fold metallo-hydrolase [Shimia gijangensis]SHJ64995.1 Glyoxylase, beta-lactamase superfamily II [Shimia gijangensis]
MARFAGLAAVLAVMGSIAAASEDIADQYPQSELYAKPVEVIPHVFSAIGATAPPTYENSGHNNNLSFIVTDEGVVVVNGGASARLAAALHDEIKAVTDQAVVLVINENGQGHAMLGNSYWVDQGVDILAHVDAIAAFTEEADFILQGMERYNRDKAEGTRTVTPNLSFESEYKVTLGGVEIHAMHMGPAHDPGDTQVWLPQWGMLIAGDIAFHERMLPIFEGICTSCWIETWETKLEPLAPTYLIPGHGHPTNLAQVRRYTHDYLVDLREKIGTHIEEGGDLSTAYYVDQERWKGLDTFEELATKNAGRVFEEMEWE